MLTATDTTASDEGTSRTSSEWRLCRSRLIDSTCSGSPDFVWWSWSTRVVETDRYGREIRERLIFEGRGA